MKLWKFPTIANDFKAMSRMERLVDKYLVTGWRLWLTPIGWRRLKSKRDWKIFKRVQNKYFLGIGLGKKRPKGEVADFYRGTFPTAATKNKAPNNKKWNAPYKQKTGSDK